MLDVWLNWIDARARRDSDSDSDVVSPSPLTDPIRCRLLSLLVFGFCGYETNLFASPACVCVRLSVRVHVPVCVGVHKVLIYFKL